MTDIIHANADRIRELFGQSEQHTMRIQMESEIANCQIKYDSVLCAGIVRPLFRALDTAEIVCKYADEFINLAATTESSFDNLKIALAMVEPRNAIANETRLLADRL